MSIVGSTGARPNMRLFGLGVLAAGLIAGCGSRQGDSLASPASVTPAPVVSIPCSAAGDRFGGDCIGSTYTPEVVVKEAVPPATIKAVRPRR
jgi:hypothetical protein